MGFLLEVGFAVVFAVGEIELLEVAFAVGLAVALAEVFAVGLALALIVAFTVDFGVGFFVAAFAVGTAHERASMRRKLVNRDPI